MDEKKKILLGDKDIKSKSNEDLFVNINLNQTFAEIRDDTFENIFDVSKQFNRERNASRNFRIYGTIDAVSTNSDGLTIEIYSAGTFNSSAVTTVSGLINTINSTAVVYNEVNAFDKKIGKYLIELDNYQSDFVFLKIPSDNLNYGNQFYVQQLVFKDASGTFIDYGTQTNEIDDNGNLLVINNDFYFLYNKHWIKKDLKIVNAKISTVSFSAITDPLIMTESNSASVVFAVTLDQTSPFGLEKVDLIIANRTLDNSSIEIRLSDENFNPISQPPLTLSFAVGEQIKIFNFQSLKDIFQEFQENVTFKLENFVKVFSGNDLTQTVIVNDATPRNKVRLNFQDTFQNRDYFYGQRFGSVNTKYSGPMPAILRNGLFFDGTPMEFYPIDSYTLRIRNIGNTTMLPPNPIFGIFNEQLFPANQQLNFNINQQYQNTQKHTIKLTLPQSAPAINWARTSGFTINGVPIVDYLNPNYYRFDYATILACLTKQPVGNFYPGGWNRYNLDTPFDVIPNSTAFTITLVAKNPGTRLDLKPYGVTGNIFL